MANEFIVKNGLLVSGSVRISGGIVAQSFTGSFSGSISTAISASYATTASYLNPLTQNVSVTGNVQASNLVSVADVASGNKIYNNNFYVTNDGSTNIGNGQSVATAKLQIKGSGTTSSTTSLLVQNANSSASLSVLDDGTATIRNGLIVSGGDTTINGTTGTVQLQKNGTNFVYINNDSYGLRLYGNEQISMNPGFGVAIGPSLFLITSNYSGYRGVNIRGGWNLNLSDTPLASAILQADSTTKGFLPPRTNLTSNISAPAQGLQTYLTGSTNEGLYYYNSGSYQGWTRVLNSTGSQAITGSLTVVGTTNLGGATFSNGGATFANNVNVGTLTEGGAGNSWINLNGTRIHIGQNGSSAGLNVVSSTQYVGIGKDTPNTTLDVVGNVLITGSLNATTVTASNALINGNLTVVGTASFTYSTSSIINIGASTVTLNTNNPAVRFGGLTVVDSGSFGTSSTGSLLWDSQNNRWIYSNPSGSSYDGGLLISGPRNSSGLGNEEGTTLNALMKGQGGDHITSSGVFEVSGSVGIGTTSPAYTLDVSGSARFTDTIYTNFAIATATTAVLARGFSDGNFQLVTQNGASVSGYGISTTFGMIYSGSGDVAKINFHRGTGAGTGHISISSPLKIGDTSTTAPAAQFTVKGSGTTSSTTALLIQNSAGTTTTSVLDDGRLSCYGDLYVGTSSGGGASIFQNSGNILNLTADNNHDVTLTQIKARRVPAGGGVRIENTNAPSNPDSSAQLDVVSTTKGLLPPRTNLTSNISTPAQGLQTYITASATEGLYYYNSGSYQGWTRVLNDSGSQAITGSLIVTGGITGSFSGSGTITSASFASTASYVNPLVQNVLVTGSMYVSGSINAGSQVVLGYNVNNGYLSFPQNGSNEIAAAQYLYITKTGGSGWLQIRSWNFVDIDSSLGVGLNSVTPSARLHVKGSGATSSTTALLIQNANATASLSVLDDGRVGIGTSTPTASLEIVDNSATTTTPLRVKNGSSSGTAGIAIVGGPIGNQASSVLIQGVDIGGWKQNMAVSIYDGTSGGGGSVVERLRLYDNGSLGLIGGSTDLPNMLRLTNGQDTLGNRTGIHFGTYSKVAIYNIITTTTSYGRGALGFAINDAVSSATASLSDEKMRLTAVGLGIGTTTPSASLHVVGNTILSGSAGTGSALYAYKSGSTVVDIQGSQGQLFSVVDTLSGSLMSVNDISGLPILEVFSDDRVVMGTYGAPALIITGSNAVFTGSVIIDGALLDTVRTGSLPVGSTLVYAVNTGSYTAGFFDYYVTSGSNYRAGNIMAVWGANSIRYTDLATPDIGTTIQLQFSMSLSNATAQLFATATSTGWTVKTVFRTI